MNAYVHFNTNRTGILNVTPAQRNEARQSVYSTAKATLTGGLATEAVKSATTESSRAVNQELSRDAFLQLLVEQLRHQDPMEPISNENMLAQLAQFSALEQMENLNKGFQSLSVILAHQTLLQSGGLVGREIEGITENGNEVSGTVDRVFVQNGMVFVGLGEYIVAVDSITQIG